MNTEAFKSQRIKTFTFKIYEVLENLKDDTTEYITEKWEREANTKISTEGCFGGSTGERNRVTNRLRPCQTIKVDYFHIFWGCSLINQYWTEIKKGRGSLDKASTLLWDNAPGKYWDRQFKSIQVLMTMKCWKLCYWPVKRQLPEDGL